MFRFTIRDVLCLTVVVGLGCMLWLEHARLSVTRSHAHELRDNLLSAQWHYAPRTHSNRMFGNGEAGAVKWEMTEQPIP
jgi:hypothetical protein